MQCMCRIFLRILFQRWMITTTGRFTQLLTDCSNIFRLLFLLYCRDRLRYPDAQISEKDRSSLPVCPDRLRGMPAAGGRDGVLPYGVQLVFGVVRGRKLPVRRRGRRGGVRLARELARRAGYAFHL